MLKALALLGALLLAAPAFAQPQAPGATLSGIRARGILNCGISTGDPAWSQPDVRGVWQGLDADLCRAVAAAVLGDAGKIAWHPLTGQNRFPALSGGQIELLARTTTWTFLRDSMLGLNFTAPYFMDGQGFLVKVASGVERAAQLEGASVCFTSASTHELNLQDWARTNRIRFQPVIFADKDEARRAYESGRCDAYTADASQLAAVRAAFPDPAQHRLLPDLISNTLEVVKLTSIASVVALPELLFQARQAQSVTYNATPIVAAAVVYFVLLWPVVRLLSRLENRQLAGRT